MGSFSPAVESAVGLTVSDVQSALRNDRIDAWLLYDFRGINQIAADLTAVNRQGGHLATRRWYYLIPATGEPRKLVHAIERDALAHLPGSTTKYAGRDQLESGLDALLGGLSRVAMEYSPRCAIPYVSRVDTGKIELVRQRGIEVVSSGDLVQRFAAVVVAPCQVAGERHESLDELLTSARIAISVPALEQTPSLASALSGRGVVY